MKLSNILLIAFAAIGAFYLLQCNGKRHNCMEELTIERNASGHIVKINDFEVEPPDADTILDTVIQKVFRPKVVEKIVKRRDTVERVVFVDKYKYLKDPRDVKLLQSLTDSLDHLDSLLHEFDTAAIYAGIEKQPDGYAIAYSHKVRGELLGSAYAIKFPSKVTVSNPQKEVYRLRKRPNVNFYMNGLGIRTPKRYEFGAGANLTTKRFNFGYGYNVTANNHLATFGISLIK